MESKSQIAVVAAMVGILVLITFPVIKGISQSLRLWFYYLFRLLVITGAGKLKSVWLTSFATSLGGATLSLYRDIQFWWAHGHSMNLTLTPVNPTIQTGDILIIAHGNWGQDKKGHFDHLKLQLGNRYRTHRIFIAEWPAQNNQRTRNRSAEELARQLKLLLQGGQSVYLVGHSHGGSVVAMAAALLPAKAVGGLVTIATPFIISKKSAVSRSDGMAMQVVIAFLLPLALTLSVYVWFPFQSFGSWCLAAIALLSSVAGVVDAKRLLQASGHVSLAHYSGENFTAITAKEDLLNDLLSSVVMMQRCADAIFKKLESNLATTQKNFFWNTLASTLFPMVSLFLALTYAYSILPANSTEGYSAVLLVGVSVYVSGLSCLLYPNPFFGMLGYFCGQLFAGAIRFVPNILLRRILGVWPGAQSSVVTTVSDGSEVASSFVPLEVGGLSNVHMALLGNNLVLDEIFKSIPKSEVSSAQQ